MSDVPTPAATSAVKIITASIDDFHNDTPGAPVRDMPILFGETVMLRLLIDDAAKANISDIGKALSTMEHPIEVKLFSGRNIVMITRTGPVSFVAEEAASKAWLADFEAKNPPPASREEAMKRAGDDWDKAHPATTPTPEAVPAAPTP